MSATYLARYRAAHPGSACPYTQITPADIPAWNVLRAAYAEHPLTAQIYDAETWWVQGEDRRRVLRVVTAALGDDEVQAHKKAELDKRMKR